MSEEHHLFITPPTLFLPTDGLRIAVIGINDEWTEELGDILESALPSVPMTFYHLDEATSSQWQWLYHMSATSNLVVINVAEATDIEMLMAVARVDENRLWFYVEPGSVDEDIVSLLNTFEANIFSSPDQIVTILRSYM